MPNIVYSNDLSSLFVTINVFETASNTEISSFYPMEYN
jgi:hypothetical protein